MRERAALEAADDLRREGGQGEVPPFFFNRGYGGNSASGNGI